MKTRLLVTGGAGFIGSAVLRYVIKETDWHVINIDKLTYAGNLQSLSEIESSNRYRFEQVDICDQISLQRIFYDFKPNKIMHLAAESHVDRSIDGPASFIETNITGTYTLLEVARQYWNNLSIEEKENFRFHHISTDEVFGSLGEEGLFSETTPYSPRSPYSASKASSDHLVNAWYHTYGFPVVITNCSNNFGPFQFPEKLIPLTIINALNGKLLSVYGDGKQVRDWLYVNDHVKALLKVLNNGKPGETYAIGGKNEKMNLEVVTALCDILDEVVPNHPKGVNQYNELITFVEDRPGHDQRYAIDSAKIENELGWFPEETFDSALKKTVSWYLDNKDWWARIINRNYRGERLGIIKCQ